MTAAKYPPIGQGQWGLLKEVLDMGKLDVRVTAVWMGGRTLESARQTRDKLLVLSRPPESLDDRRLLSGGVKLYIYGAAVRALDRTRFRFLPLFLRSGRGALSSDCRTMRGALYIS